MGNQTWVETDDLISLIIFLCYILTIVMNNVVLDFSKKKFFDCFKIILKMTLYFVWF
jgi:hypothetical protein